MKREQLENLLGGYAAGTLTPAERDALFAAAIEDQELFDSLVREEPLRELMANSEARSELLAALDDLIEPWYHRDVPIGLIATVAATLVLGTLAVEYWPVRTAPAITVVAQAVLPQPNKSALPTQLPFFLLGETPQPKQKPMLPPAPKVAFQRPSDSLPRSLASMLPHDVPVPPQEEAMARAPAGIGGLRAMAFAPAAARPALHFVYEILRKSAEGQFSIVDGRTPLDPGDEAAISVKPDSAGYLYVLERTAQPSWRLLSNERVEASRQYTVPARGVFRSDGQEKREFLLVLSRVVQVMPENIPATSALSDAVVAGSAEVPRPFAVSITLTYK
jgi:hypothetical protein